jgi:hypothetical protein
MKFKKSSIKVFGIASIFFVSLLVVSPSVHAAPDYSSGDFLMQNKAKSAGFPSGGAVGTGGYSQGVPAVSGPTGSDQTITNPLKFGTLEELLNAILGAMITLGTIALTFAFVWLGFSYVLAQGKPAEISKLHKSFIWTCAGGLVLLGAKGILTVIQATAGSITTP